MRGQELESTAVLHEIKVLFGRLGEISRAAEGDSTWRFPPIVFNRLSQIELLGFAAVLEAFPQTRNMVECLRENGTALACSLRHGQPADVPHPVPPKP